MPKYVISERCYEYNDEGYDASDGGVPVKIYDTKEEANAALNDLNIKWVKEQGVEVLTYCFTIDSPSELAHFPEGIFVCDFVERKRKYNVYFNDMADLSNLPDDLCLDIIKRFGENPYFITEL
jgi:hypothetical protein